MTKEEASWCEVRSLKVQVTGLDNHTQGLAWQGMAWLPLRSRKRSLITDLLIDEVLPAANCGLTVL